MDRICHRGGTTPARWLGWEDEPILGPAVDIWTWDDFRYRTERMTQDLPGGVQAVVMVGEP